MATISTDTIGNTRFIGTPLTVSVTAGAPANATFHRVRLVVSMPAGSRNPTTMKFSTPVTAEQTVLFDIASALRAFAEQHDYSATVLDNYPRLSADLSAYDDYMTDGEEHSGTGEATATISGFYCGSLADLERITGTLPATYSHKPTSSPEICYIGYQHLQPGPLSTDTASAAPSVTAVTVSSGSSSGNIYGIPAPRDGYELRFINSLGVHENVFLGGFHQRDVNIQTDKYVITRQETLTQLSRGLALKSNDRERWTLSSPPLDREWQSWYIHELLMARWAWINVGGRYLPCHILPDESLQLLNSQKAEAMTVPVVIEMNLNGPII